MKRLYYYKSVFLKFVFILTSLMLFSSAVTGPSDEAPITGIPWIIWQTYKTKLLPIDAKNARDTWIAKNPEYTYVLWDDNDIEKYILQNWDDDTYAFFKELPLGVMKADLWRYLILKTEGGIYSDIDSICCLPIKFWDRGAKVSFANVLLVGLEDNCHFCQWTIAATPNHPAMVFVCNYLVNKWKERGIDTKNPHFVHATTGPAVWTEALISYFGEIPPKSAGEIYQKYLKDPEFKQRINKLGVFLFSKGFYGGYASKNLYGSQTFGDGYVKWIDEVSGILNQNAE